MQNISFDNLSDDDKNKLYEDFKKRQSKEKPKDKARITDIGENIQNIFKEEGLDLSKEAIQKKELVNIEQILKSIADKTVEIDDGALEVAKTFGQGRNALDNIKSAMADTIPFMISLGEEATKAFDIMSETSEEIGRNLLLDENTIKSLTLIERVLGQPADKVVDGFNRAGMSVQSISGEMEKVQKYLSSVGVPVQKVAGEVVNYLDKLSLYNFSNGVEGLAKMAAKASAMRFDIGETFKFSEKLLDPKSALDFSNALSRLGITTSALIDPLRAMQMAFYEPEELQKELGNMLSTIYTLNKEGNKFEINPLARMQLSELAQQTGISSEKLQKLALSQAKAIEQGKDFLSGINVPKLSKPIDENTEDLIRNMAELNERGEWEIDVGGEKKIVRDIDDAFLEKMKKMGADQSKSMEDIAKEQRNVQQQILDTIKSIASRPAYGAATSETATKTLDIGSDLAKSAYKAVEQQMDFKVSKFSKATDDVSEAVTSIVKGIISPEVGMVDVFKKMTEEGNKFADFLKKMGSGTIEAGRVFSTEMEKNETFSGFTDYFKDLFKSFTTQEENPPTKVNDAIIDLGSSIVEPLPYETIAITPDAGEFNDEILNNISLYMEKIVSELKPNTESKPQNVSVNLTNSVNEPQQNNKENLTELSTFMSNFFDKYQKQFTDNFKPINYPEKENITNTFTPKNEIKSVSVEGDTLISDIEKLFSKIEFPVEDKTFSVEDKTFPVEDKTFSVEDKTFYVESKIDVNGTTLISNIENLFSKIELPVEDKTLLVESKSVLVEGEPFMSNLQNLFSEIKLPVEDKTFSVESKMDVDGTKFLSNLNDLLSNTKLSLKDTEVSLKNPELFNNVVTNITKDISSITTLVPPMNQQTVQPINNEVSINPVESPNLEQINRNEVVSTENINNNTKVDFSPLTLTIKIETDGKINPSEFEMMLTKSGSKITDAIVQHLSSGGAFTNSSPNNRLRQNYNYSQDFPLNA